MESLALLVSLILLTLVFSALVAVIVAWKAKKRHWKVLSLILSLPAAFIGLNLVLKTGSLGGTLIGLAGLAAPIICAFLVKRHTA